VARIRTIKPEFWATTQQAWTHGYSVYVVQERRSGPIKIGIASHPLQRLTALQSGNPRKLTLRAVFCGNREDCKAVEKYILQVFSSFSVLGEWLSCDLMTVLNEISKFAVQP
jgi:hypothetical protein